MTRLVLSFVVVTLWAMPTADSTGLLSPIDAVSKLLFQKTANANDRRFHYGDQHKDEKKVPVSPMMDPSCDDSNVVEKFTSKFTNEIFSSHELYDLFGVTLCPEDAEVAYDRIVYNGVDNVNTCYPRTVSHIVSDAIGETFGNLTQTAHVQSYGYAVATHMKSNNVLTCENLNELCDSYIFYVEQAASNVPHIKDPRNAHIQAVSESLVHFLSSLGLYTADKVRPIAQYFADFLYFITGIPTKLARA